jgi:hypothetical protein
MVSRREPIRVAINATSIKRLSTRLMSINSTQLNGAYYY